MRPVAKFLTIFGLMILSAALIVQQAQAASIQSLPNLSTVTFIEMTGSAHEKTFAFNSAELTTRLSDPMYYSYYTGFHSLPAPYDFLGASAYNAFNDLRNYSECYDVFYSDASGNFNSSGEYITIEAVWPRYQGYPSGATGVATEAYDTGPVGGGLNIAAVYLTFADSSKVYADVTTSYVAFGDNTVPASYGWATDGSDATTTVMGNTVQPGHPTRLSITVGFTLPGTPPPAVPEPGTIILLGCGLAGLVGYTTRLKK